MKMGFDILTRTLLEEFTTHTPHTVDDWYGPWATILTQLFPSSKGYVITPRRHVEGLSIAQIPNLIIDVAKVTLPSPGRRTVLVVEIKNSQHWDHGEKALMQRIRSWTTIAFTETAECKLYWIGAIGPHWMYGEKEDDEQAPKPLIGWHDVIHDDASYRDLLQLVELVASL
jgi:hypothetical protein